MCIQAEREKLLQLAWNLDDLSRLSQDGRKLKIEVAAKDPNPDLISANIPHQLHESLVAFVKGWLLSSMSCIGLYRHRRTPATHVFVMMISTEARYPMLFPYNAFRLSNFEEF